MKVYVAGPYSADPDACTVEAMSVAHQVMDLGHAPFVPHLYHYMHLMRERGYEDWMTADLVYLRVCDVILRMPGHSPGADREVELARELGIPVVYSVDALAQEGV